MGEAGAPRRLVAASPTPNQVLTVTCGRRVVLVEDDRQPVGQGVGLDRRLLSRQRRHGGERRGDNGNGEGLAHGASPRGGSGRLRGPEPAQLTPLRHPGPASVGRGSCGVSPATSASMGLRFQLRRPTQSEDDGAGDDPLLVGVGEAGADRDGTRGTSGVTRFPGRRRSFYPIWGAVAGYLTHCHAREPGPRFVGDWGQWCAARGVKRGHPVGTVDSTRLDPRVSSGPDSRGDPVTRGHGALAVPAKEACNA